MRTGSAICPKVERFILWGFHSQRDTMPPGRDSFSIIRHPQFPTLSWRGELAVGPSTADTLIGGKGTWRGLLTSITSHPVTIGRRIHWFLLLKRIGRLLLEDSWGRQISFNPGTTPSPTKDHSFQSEFLICM